MKLFFCLACNDTLKMLYEKRTCYCGKSWGRYLEGGDHAEIGGMAVPIGLGNTSLSEALAYRPIDGNGKEFLAFVIAENCDKITQHGNVPERPPSQAQQHYDRFMELYLSDAFDDRPKG